MTVHVEQMTSDVTVEPEPEGAGQAPGVGPTSRWDDEERYRDLRERIAADRLRTAADGFDD